MNILVYVSSLMFVFAVGYFVYTLVNIANDAMKLKGEKWELNIEL